MTQERIAATVDGVVLQSECVHDTDGDGNCQRCARHGGCITIGGPFIRCVDCGEVKPNAEMMIRQPYCRSCY